MILELFVAAAVASHAQSVNSKPHGTSGLTLVFAADPLPHLSIDRGGVMHLKECDGAEIVVGRFDVLEPPVGSFGPIIATTEDAYHPNAAATSDAQRHAMALLFIAAARGPWPTCPK